MQASSVVQRQECNPQFVLNPMRIISNVSSAFGRNIKLQNLGYLPETEKRRFTVKAVPCSVLLQEQNSLSIWMITMKKKTN